MLLSVRLLSCNAQLKCILVLKSTSSVKNVQFLTPASHYKRYVLQTHLITNSSFPSSWDGDDSQCHGQGGEEVVFFFVANTKRGSRTYSNSWVCIQTLWRWNVENAKLHSNCTLLPKGIFGNHRMLKTKLHNKYNYSLWTDRLGPKVQLRVKSSNVAMLLLLTQRLCIFFPLQSLLTGTSVKSKGGLDFRWDVK